MRRLVVHALWAASILCACSQGMQSSTGYSAHSDSKLDSAEGLSESGPSDMPVVPPASAELGVPTPQVKSNAFGFRLPHSIYPIGDWLDSTNGQPYAVAISDVTRDGRKDVVLVTLRNHASAPLEVDHKVIVFPQGADGNLLPFTLHAYSDGLYERVNNYIYAAVQISDMDLDGYDDIVVGYGKGIAVLLSRDGGFETKKYLIAPEFRNLPPWDDNQYIRLLAAVDVDQDGYGDIIAFNAGSGATIFMNDRSGGMDRIQSTLHAIASPTDVKVGDLNADGRSDIVVLSGHRETRRFWFVRNAGNGQLVDHPSYHIEVDDTYGGIALGEWTGDHLVDIAISVVKNIPQAGSPPGLLIFEQASGGHFLPPYLIPTWQVPHSLVTTDLDGDLIPDLLVDHPGWDIGYLLARPDGLEPEKIVNNGFIGSNGNGPQVLAVGDINGDGCNDLVRSELNISLMIYFGQNCLRYTRQTGGRYPPRRVH